MKNKKQFREIKEPAQGHKMDTQKAGFCDPSAAEPALSNAAG